MNSCALSCLQVNTRKIYDEANVLEGVFDNKIFSTILAAELALQVGCVAMLLLMRSMPASASLGLSLPHAVSSSRAVFVPWHALQQRMQPVDGS